MVAGLAHKPIQSSTKVYRGDERPCNRSSSAAIIGYPMSCNLALNCPPGSAGGYKCLMFANLNP